VLQHAPYRTEQHGAIAPTNLTRERGTMEEEEETDARWWRISFGNQCGLIVCHGQMDGWMDVFIVFIGLVV